MVRGFKFRFYPTVEQKPVLAKTFGCVRVVYNWGLNLRSKSWYENEIRINYAQTSSELTKLKQLPEVAWLNEVSCVPLQQSLRHLQTAYANFWEKRAKYPSLKRKSGKQSAEFTGSAFKWKNGELSVSKIGRLKIKWSRSFIGNPTTVTLSKTPDGKYFVSFLVDEPLPTMPKTKNAIGIDLGLEAFAVTSQGSKFQSPRPLRRKMAQLKRAQKQLSRKKRGSKNRGKARIRVAKIHGKITDTRTDFLHKLTTRLVRENQTIVVEDLDVRQMMANHPLAGAIGDSGWGEFWRQLSYKTLWYGRKLVTIDRFYPSSKRCSTKGCGYISPVMPLNVRQWACPSCNTTHDRDVNAAKNILAAGLAVTACGGSVRPIRAQARSGSSR